MKSIWKVTSNSICGATVYAVYRQVDVDQVDHSGNREYATEYIDSREAAQAITNDMNERGKE